MLADIRCWPTICKTAVPIAIRTVIVRWYSRRRRPPRRVITTTARLVAAAAAAAATRRATATTITRCASLIAGCCCRTAPVPAPPWTRWPARAGAPDYGDGGETPRTVSCIGATGAPTYRCTSKTNKPCASCVSVVYFFNGRSKHVSRKQRNSGESYRFARIERTNERSAETLSSPSSMRSARSRARSLFHRSTSSLPVCRVLF